MYPEYQYENRRNRGSIPAVCYPDNLSHTRQMPDCTFNLGPSRLSSHILSRLEPKLPKDHKWNSKHRYHNTTIFARKFWRYLFGDTSVPEVRLLFGSVVHWPYPNKSAQSVVWSQQVTVAWWPLKEARTASDERQIYLFENYSLRHARTLIAKCARTRCSIVSAVNCG